MAENLPLAPNTVRLIWGLMIQRRWPTVAILLSSESDM